MIETQKQKFVENWNKNHALFGQKTWDKDIDFIYYIEFPLPMEVSEKLLEEAQNFFAKIELEKSFLLAPTELHLTITLPGRLGTHFQKNDISFMKKTLENITKDMRKIPLEIKALNVFPEVVFAEIYDPTDRLQQLHETLCNEIPFSQHPEFRYQNYLPHISLAYGGQTQKTIPKNMPREINSINLNLDNIHFGRVKWQDGQLEKPLIAEYKLS